MGYNTQFAGELKFTTELNAEQRAKLESMLGQDCRQNPQWWNETGDDNLTDIDLQVSEDGDGLEWDGAEKTYQLVEKVNLVIREMRKTTPEFGLSGSMLAQGEDIGDVWELVIGPSGFAERREFQLEGESRLTAQHARLLVEAFVMDMEGEDGELLRENNPELYEAQLALVKLAECE